MGSRGANARYGRSLYPTFKSKDNEIQLNNILIGEVWLCSGQSNMAWSATTGSGIDDAEKEVANADYPNIRLFTVERRASKYPQEDLPAFGRYVPPKP